MTWYIILAILIGFGFYLLYSNRSKKVNIQSASNQNVHDKHSADNHSKHDHKKGHGCC